MRRFRIETIEPPPAVSDWTPIILSRTSPVDPGKMEAERAITELLECDHIIVLAGLGTSLCIKDPSDKSLFPTMNGLWVKVREEVGGPEFDRVKTDVGYTDGTNIEELLSRCQMKLGLEPPSLASTPAGEISPATPAAPDIRGFVEKAEKVIRTECKQTLGPDSTTFHEDFLRRLVRRGPRRPRVNLFTTNYDLCFETAAARIGLPVIDGFSFSVPPQFQPEVFDYDIVTTSSYSKEPDFIPRLLRLFKLHGSVDWHPDGATIIKQRDTDSPVLIYPREKKYAASYSPPFLEIMSRLQTLLRQRSVGLLSVCCGFNDLHIAEPVLSAVKSNANLRMVVCAPDLCEKDAQTLPGRADDKGAAETNSTLRQCNHLISNGDGRITFINCFFPDLIKLMPTTAGQTEAEQHEDRIKKLEAEIAKLKAAPGVIP